MTVLDSPDGPNLPLETRKTRAVSPTGVWEEVREFPGGRSIHCTAKLQLSMCKGWRKYLRSYCQPPADSWPGNRTLTYSCKGNWVLPTTWMSLACASYWSPAHPHFDAKKPGESKVIPLTHRTRINVCSFEELNWELIFFQLTSSPGHRS